MRFSHWLKLQEFTDTGPVQDPVVQDRRPDYATGGVGDKLPLNNPMKRSAPTSAFPTYSLPSKMKKR